MFAGTDGSDKDPGGPGGGPVSWSSAAAAMYGKGPPLTPSHHHLHSHAHQQQHAGSPGSGGGAGSNGGGPPGMGMNPVFQPLFQMSNQQQQGQGQGQQGQAPAPGMSQQLQQQHQAGQVNGASSASSHAAAFQAAAAAAAAAQQQHQQTALAPIANPISPAHQLLVQMHTTSRNSAAPHQRARTAAQLARSLGATPLTNQFDPNAPAPRPNSSPAARAAAAAAAAAARDTESNDADGTASLGSMTSAPNLSTSAPTSSWTILDIGGLNIRNVSPAIFNYTFLTMLYLNHNQLTSLPPAVERLRSLVLLDLSGNRLSSVPSEVGMLVNLQCLYLFDNQLATLPWEVGNLYQLESLGIEGNPMQANLMKIVQEEGTVALIAYLRDHAPVPPQPPEREWIVLETQPPTSGQSETCSVFSYNILSEKLANPKMYGYTPSWALEWPYRSDAILQEILLYSADIVCLQEVEMQVYDSFFQPQLRDLGGYESVFWPKTRARTMSDWERKSVDGCATFFRTAKYTLVDQQVIEFNQMALQKPDFKKTEDVYNRLMTKDNVAVLALLQNVETRSHILVANCHIHWDPTYRDVKLVQVAMLMEQLELVCGKYTRELAALDSATGSAGSSMPTGSNATSSGQLPVLICGDFNSTPDSGVYELLRTGRVDKAHEDFQAFNYGNYTKDGLSHRMSLKSAYADSKVAFTNFTPNFVGVIDYVWYTNNALSVIGLLGGVDKAYTKKSVGFPNAHFPSDHIPLLAEFRVCK